MHQKKTKETHSKQKLHFFLMNTKYYQSIFFENCNFETYRFSSAIGDWSIENMNLDMILIDRQRK
jgi:hypothetical protein